MRSHQSIINFFASNTRVLIGAILSIIITPLVIKYVGDSQYGTFRVFVDYFSYFSLVDIGVYSSFIVVLNKKMTNNNREEISRTFLVAKKFYKKIFSISLLIFLMTSPLIIYLVKTDQIEKSTIYFSYLFMAFSLLNLIFKAEQGFLEAQNKSSLISVGGIVQNLIFSLGTLLLGYLGFGLEGLCFAFVLSTLAPYIFYFIIVRKKIRSVSLKHREYEKEIVEINKLTKANFLVHLTGKFSLYSDTLIISFFLSPISVTYYFISSRIISLAATIPGSISSSSWAALGEIYHNGELTKFNQYIFRFSRLILVSSLIFLGPLAFISKSFVTLWIGSEYYLGELFISFVIINLFFQSVMNFWGWCLSTTHHLDRAIKLQYVGLLTNVTCSLVFTYFFGEVGPVIGTLIANVFVNIPWLLLLMKDIYGISPLKAIKDLSSHVILIILTLVLCLKGHVLFASSWIEFLLYSLAITVGYVVIIYTVVMKRTEKEFYLKLLKRIFNK